MLNPEVRVLRPLPQPPPPKFPTARFAAFLGVTALAAGLTVLFWGSLWQGDGLVGGDLYSYYLPQKQFLADELHAGRIPLWNNLVGQGYPILGESQTGLLYPPHLALYAAIRDVNTAYNVNQIGHYVLAFVAVWALARRLGLQSGASLLAALVYTYGWFPPRICLEWAIIGGAWLPVALWCCESGLQTGRWRYVCGLSLALGLQLLAGHYQFAFMTLLLVAVYVPLRIFRPDWTSASRPPEQESTARRCWKLAAWSAAVALGLALATIQLLPGWELQGLSQRTVAGQHFDPAENSIPPLYWSQLLGPWWYSPEIDLDRSLRELRWGAVASQTNKVEAHLYAGLIPFWLAVLGLIRPGLRRELAARGARFWGLAALISLILTSGWLMPWLQMVPGFGYFRGPARYGVITTLALGLLAGLSWDAVTRRWTSTWRGAGIAVVLGVTTWEFWSISGIVTYCVTVPVPPIEHREASPVRELLLASPRPVRVWAPGPNLVTLLGVSQTPVYLGLGPREYYDPKFAMPEDSFADQGPTPFGGRRLSLDRKEWLRQNGVTHVLSFEPYAEQPSGLQLAWTGMDSLLNPAWARFREPLWLYELVDAPGRFHWAASDHAEGVELTENTAERIRLTARTDGLRTLVWEDLGYPGWEVLLDGKAAEAELKELERRVKIPVGEHEVVWCYRPRTVYCGALISGLAMLVIATAGHIRFWHAELTERMLQRLGLLSVPPDSGDAGRTGRLL